MIQKEWKDKIEYKVNSKEADSILNILKQKVSDLFDYFETVDELNLSVKHYKYYNQVKIYLKSEPACGSIEVVFLGIQNKFQYVAHCYFKDMCEFNFKGESIVEAANSGLKTGSLSASTSMKIHTSAGTQLKIGENQTMKKHK